MHYTTVILKDGTELCGPIGTWRPHLNFFTLMNREGQISFDDVATAETENDRVSVHEIGVNVDIMDRARRDAKRGRENGWDDWPEKKYEWENDDD